MLILDFDDFHETNNRLDLLLKLNNHIPNIKVNLFTILGKCSLKFIDEMKEYDWIDMIPHGWEHKNNYECFEWSKDQTIIYLDMLKSYGLTKGFKAPGWQISNGVYEALLERDYWVADQSYNNERRPEKLKSYLLDEDYKVHGHIQNTCGNGLEEKFEYYKSLKGDFFFIKDII
jgi:hypothetical protein